MDKFEKLSKFFKDEKKKKLIKFGVPYVIGVLALVIVFTFILDLSHLLMPIIVISLIYAVAFSLYVVSVLNKNHKAMIKTINEAETNYEKYKHQLKEMGFVSSKHYSGFGYKWVEFRNIINLVDNLHLEIDEENKRIAYYYLTLDGDSDIIFLNYSDLISVQLDCQESLGKVITYAVTIKVKHEVGLIGLPVNDNEGFVLNSEKGLQYQKQAEQLMREINAIIAEGQSV